VVVTGLGLVTPLGTLYSHSLVNLDHRYWSGAELDEVDERGDCCASTPRRRLIRSGFDPFDLIRIICV